MDEHTKHITERICKCFIDSNPTDQHKMPLGDKKTRDEMIDELEDYYMDLINAMDDESLEFEYNLKLGI